MKIQKFHQGPALWGLPHVLSCAEQVCTADPSLPRAGERRKDKELGVIVTLFFLVKMNSFRLLFFFAGGGYWGLNSEVGRQALYHLSHSTNLSCSPCAVNF
jgi:hypothetical protein